MPFVRRNESGAIIAISLETGEGLEEVLSNDPDLLDFQAQLASEIEPLRRTDLDVIRVLDDLINLLIDQNTIRFTDLPDEAQQKLMNRRSLRNTGNTLDLFGEDPPLI